MRLKHRNRDGIRPMAFIAALVGMLALVSLRANAAPQPSQPVRFTIAAIGDILIHASLYNAAHTGGGAYDFKPLFSPVKPYLESADYTIANLEVPVAGQQRGYSGYPTFNSPVALAYALRWAGVDLVSTANNHCLDKGWSGLCSTLDNLDTVGLRHVGTARTAEEQETPLIVTIAGVKIGFIASTYGTNGIPIPKGKEFAVNLNGEGDELLAAAQRARAAGAEVVIALLHWGNEYQRQPTAQQQTLEKKLLAGGVDYIIAHHPHVVQPITRPTVMRPDGPYTGLIAYSLGNFVSGQRDRYRDRGIILYLTFEKSPAGRVALARTQYLPVYVQRGNSNGRVQYRVLPVSPDLTPSSDIAISSEARKRMRQVEEELKAHLETVEAGVTLLKVAP